MDVRRLSEERRIPCFAQKKIEAVLDSIRQRGALVWAHFCVDDHATTAEGLGDEGTRRDVEHTNDDVECVARAHVQIEMVGEHAVVRSLREDVDVGDLQTPHG